MKALVPLSDNALSQFLHGLAEYGNQDAQVSLAQQVLYGLGIATAENMPPIQNGESLPEYIERLNPTELATIEGLGIGQGQQLQEYFRIATRLILYQQYVTGRWQEYAKELDVDKWSPYVTHLLDDCLRISSESEGRRWAVAIEVIARLYHPSARGRLDLVYIGDEVIDNDTGEVEEVTQGLPATPEEAVRDSFNRYAREAGIKLRDLLRQTDTLSPAEPPFQEAASEVRRILNLATDSGLDDRAVNRQATGGRSLMPAWVLPEDTPPAWAAYLANQFPDVVSDTGSLGMGQRYVQVRLIVWPSCPKCGNIWMVIGREYPYCVRCLNDKVDGRRHASIWSTRIADEHGRYPVEWTEGDKPTAWIDGIAPESMDIHGLKVSVWEITVTLEDLDG